TPPPCDDSDFLSSPPPPHAANWGGTGPVGTTTFPTFHSTQPPPRSAAVNAGISHERQRFGQILQNFRPFVLSHFSTKLDEQDRAIVSDPTVRSEPNLQDECPKCYRTHRNFRIGIWRS
ncbi:HXXXD-type acyl-transferase family protein, partial [Prunus dulcis]